MLIIPNGTSLTERIVTILLPELMFILYGVLCINQRCKAESAEYWHVPNPEVISIIWYGALATCVHKPITASSHLHDVNQMTPVLSFPISQVYNF